MMNSKINTGSKKNAINGNTFGMCEVSVESDPTVPGDPTGSLFLSKTSWNVLLT